MKAQDSPSGIELIPETDFEQAVLGRLLTQVMHSDFKIRIEPSDPGAAEPKPLVHNDYGTDMEEDG